MTTAIDTNALLALLYEDSYPDASETALREAYQEGGLVITSIVYAELSADGHFDNATEVNYPTLLAHGFAVRFVEGSVRLHLTT